MEWDGEGRGETETQSLIDTMYIARKIPEFHGEVELILGLVSNVMQRSIVQISRDL